jgi:hypothetical protein
MSQYHIAIARNFVTIMDADSGYTIERNLEDVPQDAVDDLKRIFNTQSFKGAHWTKAATSLTMGSALKHFYLYEKAEEKRALEEQYEQVSAMGVYAGCLAHADDYAFAGWV